MISFPNCKINLGLHITRKRADGYHDLATVFVPVPWRDIIEVVSDKWIVGSKEKAEINITGLSVPGDTTSNLCIKAWELLKKDFPDLPPVHIHLHKIIPMGAGLGGGSADGAFVLKMLNEKYALGLSSSQLIAYALQLGSDCPFFIHNKPCFATGRGEILEPINLDLSNYQILLINPGIHINTKWAFEQITPQQPPRDLREVLTLPISEWKHYLYNDFEAPVAKANPIITTLKESLYADGALYAAMSGSGSTIFGIYDKNAAVTVQTKTKYLSKLVSYL
jgi:4-diphosphocytidyl-2-C-methyl-D-erythritol kinase